DLLGWLRRRGARARDGDLVRARTRAARVVQAQPEATAALLEARRRARADDPHREVVGTAAIRVPQRDARALHLIVARGAAHLAGRLEAADHARRADRVGREHAAGHVHGEVAAELRGARVGQLPALALFAEQVSLEPHRLVPRARNVELGAVDLAARIRDAGLLVQRLRALDAGSGLHRVAPRELD